MTKDGRIWLSHSGLEVLERCPRCFWLQYKRNIRQPEGIVSRLANRFDQVLKNYFNIYRPLGELPPMIKGKIAGKLENPFVEKYWAKIDDKYGFWGKLDECLINEKGEYIPVDFKTSSSDPRGRETLSAYKSQIDDYLFLMEKSGKKIAGYGYLIYFFPDEGKLLHDGFPMIIHITKLEGNPTNTTKRILNAKLILEKSIPDPSKECPFCSWYETMKTELGEIPVKSQAAKSLKVPKKYFQEKLI